jgi:hypothetical protein
MLRCELVPLKSVVKSNSVSIKKTRWVMLYKEKYTHQMQKRKGKTLIVAGRGGPNVCITSRLSNFLDNRLIVGGEVVKLMCWQPLTPGKIPGTRFCQSLGGSQGYNAVGRIRAIEI